ncbi:protein of unknown function [Methylocaldum szegediense]|uniref:Secreted protein n=1 Tax=Methylocaldum szegediense TaxID=73780 RepID=A0ABM9I1L7_9GAMM|nr:protein of unknown function [Methylocaldum szegediense]
MYFVGFRGFCCCTPCTRRGCDGCVVFGFCFAFLFDVPQAQYLYVLRRTMGYVFVACLKRKARFYTYYGALCGYDFPPPSWRRRWCVRVSAL